MKKRLSKKTLVMVFALLSFISCSYQTPDGEYQSSSSVEMYNALLSAPTKDVVEQWFRDRSLGGQLHVVPISGKNLNALMIQTFPYSGIRASHLYFYQESNDNYYFLGMLRITIIRNVDANFDPEQQAVVVTDPENEDPIVAIALRAV